MRLVANLLCEATWADVDVPARIQRASSALGTLMGALAREGDTVWTPMSVDAARVVAGAGLPNVALESGPLEALSPAPSLAWGETDATARARPMECAVRGGPTSEHWLDVIRALRRPTSETHRRVCDRRRQLVFAKRAGLSLPDSYTFARMPRDVGGDTFSGFLVPSSQGRLRLSFDQLFGGEDRRWVVKAPWSSAGRERLRGRGWPLPEPDTLRLSRLLDTYGKLVVEPWCERVAEFGSIAYVAGGVVRRIGFHATETTGGGAFRGLRPLPEVPVEDGLTGDEMVALHGATQAAGGWLAAEGYEGPFGLDAWRYVDGGGATRFHAMGELNARLTFGFVARRLAEGAGWDARSDRAGPALQIGGEGGEGDGARPLLRAGDDGVSAWSVD